MKYALFFLLLACSQPEAGHPIIRSLGGGYCCDTVRTLNNTAVVKSVFDTSGNLIDFEIVKVLK